MIFLSVVVLIAQFCSERLCLSDRSVYLLERFQICAAKRIQIFSRLVPNVCTMFPIGWIRLERMIELKKVLFIHSILMLTHNV